MINRPPGYDGTSFVILKISSVFFTEMHKLNQWICILNLTVSHNFQHANVMLNLRVFKVQVAILYLPNCLRIFPLCDQITLMFISTNFLLLFETECHYVTLACLELFGRT